jgi:peroxiredoxin
VDSIVCLSVNDAFVMGAWGKSQNAEELLMVADGNGSFTKAVGWNWMLPASAWAPAASVTP